MGNPRIPFYSQAALIDRYVKMVDPATDPVAVKVILEMLHKHQDLRHYFFRSSPSSAWAPILWENGFFSQPPEPETNSQGTFLAHWDVQYYLIEVASQVPDIVVKHVQTIQAPGWYIAQAARALCNIAVEISEQAVPAVIQWCDNLRDAQDISSEVETFLQRLVEAQRIVPSLAVFEALTKPRKVEGNVPQRHWRFGYNPVGLTGTLLEPQINNEYQTLESILQLAPTEVTEILEKQFRDALQLLASSSKAPPEDDFSLLRVAIEDTDQDMRPPSPPEQLLIALRKALEHLVIHDVSKARVFIESYMHDALSIFKRLAIHILNRFPDAYLDLTRQVLNDPANLEDANIHHEFFLLLRSGFHTLRHDEQQTLILNIMRGPRPEAANRVADLIAREMGEGYDRQEYLNKYRKSWILDRLWMIRQYLSGESKALLDKLFTESGAPAHPEFTMYMPEGGWVRDVSPISEEELGQLSDTQLIHFLESWQPKNTDDFSLEPVTYLGLARTLANAIAANPDKYKHQINSIARTRVEYASAIFRRFNNQEQPVKIPWQMCVELSAYLLADNAIVCDTQHTFDGSWTGVRLEIAWLFERGIVSDNAPIPAELLDTVKDLLMLLIHDPDPSVEDDENSKDPVTAALNHIRPVALQGLIYLVRRLRMEQCGQEPCLYHLPHDIIVAFNERLDLERDPSPAIKAVFGRNFPLLYWIDQEWTKANIDHIFTSDGQASDCKTFMAAFDSFVLYNAFYIDFAPILRAKYTQAIDCLLAGYKAEVHLNPVAHLCGHIACEYLLADYHLLSPEGQASLLMKLYSIQDSGIYSSIAHGLVSAYKSAESEKDKFWERLRVVLEYRLRTALAADHSVEYDDEMRQFAQMLPKLPQTETMESLWPILEGLVPHIARREYVDIGWEAVEEFLVEAVKTDPVRVAQYYRIMNSANKGRHWYDRHGKGSIIINTAIKSPTARGEVCLLIDRLARNGMNEFLDVYNEYCV